MNIPSDVPRQDIARAFRLCLSQLSTGAGGDNRTNYICYALGRAANLNGAPAEGALWASAVVRDRIYPFVSAARWLVDSVPEAHDATHYQIQQWRRTWITSLIEEFSK